MLCEKRRGNGDEAEAPHEKEKSRERGVSRDDEPDPTHCRRRDAQIRPRLSQGHRLFETNQGAEETAHHEGAMGERKVGLGEGKRPADAKEPRIDRRHEGETRWKDQENSSSSVRRHGSRSVAEIGTREQTPSRSRVK